MRIKVGDVVAKKSFGQHFLKDLDVVETIVSAAELVPHESVLEIGPGTGVLTNALLEKEVVLTAIEADRDLWPRLEGQFGENVNLLKGDAREFIPKLTFAPFSYKVVANLPYNVANFLVSQLLYEAPTPSSLIVMVQKEVGERWMAAPGEMGILSLAMQLRARVEIVCLVPKSAFHPPPKVESIVMKLTPFRPGEEGFHTPQEAESILKVAKRGFVSPRKQLVRLLADTPEEREQLQTFLISRSRSPQARAQELSIGDWEALAQR